MHGDRQVKKFNVAALKRNKPKHAWVCGDRPLKSRSLNATAAFHRKEKQQQEVGGGGHDGRQLTSKSEQDVNENDHDGHFRTE